jgi:acetyl esterase/lipase
MDKLIMWLNTMICICIMVMFMGIISLSAQETEKWPDQVKDITYLSDADSTLQPALFYDSGNQSERPLLVALHTWSNTYKQSGSIPYAHWCIEKDWVFIHPDFRGANDHPEACGSSLAMADIQAAVQWVKNRCAVDTNRIYLVGASGGGMAALLAAAMYPQIWTAVSAWVPVTDLQAWYREGMERHDNYPEMIQLSCGGAPGASEKIDREYRLRSPLTHLLKARGVKMDINSGIHDGYTGSVPVSHTLLAFNALAAESDRLSDEQIRYFVSEQKVPPDLIEPLNDATYGQKKPLFRRQSGQTRVTIFDGGHEIIFEAALSWLAAQKGRTKIKD